MKKTILMSIAVFMLVAHSCKKDKKEEVKPLPPKVQDTFTDGIPRPADANGLLVGIRTLTYQEVPFFGEMKSEFGTATAFFLNNPGLFSSSNYLNAGKVSLNNEDLIEQSNVYLYNQGLTSISGIDFSNGVNWNVQGSSSVQGFSQNSTFFPSVDPYILSGDIFSSVSYSLSLRDSILDCDSLYFKIHTTKGVLYKSAPVGVNNMVFSPQELQSIFIEEDVSLEISAVKMYKQTHNNKQHYFVNKSTTVKVVRFKP